MLIARRPFRAAGFPLPSDLTGRIPFFEYKWPEICGQEWGRLYRMYHTNPYSKAAVNERLKQLLDDSYVSNSRGVIEYILGGERDVSLLHIRVF